MDALPEPTTDTTEDAAVSEPPGAADENHAETPAITAARRMIAVSDLAAHPGNVRDDLHLTSEFTASVAAEGVRIPLLVTTSPDGGWRVIEGHRRLAAAIAAGLAEVPCDIDPGRAGDEAGQYLDMLLANSDGYRANYTTLEESAALFAAHEAGASRTRIRKATGRTAAQVKTALAAGGLSTETRAAAAQLSSEVTLDELALLAEFDQDEAATERLLTCLDHGWPLEHAAERIRRDRAEATEHQKIRADLEAAGVPVTDGLPPGAGWLTSLSHDGDDLTPEAHASCAGHGATFARWNLLEPSYYCTSPAGHGHASRWALSGTASASNDDDSTSAGTGPRPDPAPDPDRRLVITGNKGWQAAADVRHRWLTASLFPRRTAPRDAHAFLARQLLAMPDPLHAGLAAARHKPLFAVLTGRTAEEWDTECDTATSGRLAIIMLAPIITAYEHAMTEAEGRNTWRTDRYSPCPRRHAARYLTFLATLGYQLSDIEQAVADGVPWTGTTPSASLPGSASEPEDPAPGDRPAADPDQDDQSNDVIDPPAEAGGDDAPAADDDGHAVGAAA